MRPASVARFLLLGLVLVVLGGALVRARLEPRQAERGASRDARGFLLLEGERLPNVLLLTVDTLRADHVAGAGNSYAVLTPTLDRLAASGTVFLHTTAPAPATRPALAGLHTGSYPHRHGVTSNFAAVPFDPPVLAELLRQRGYLTAAFYGNSTLKPMSGFGRGFKTYKPFPRESFSNDGVGVTMALDWLQAAPRQPWFLWLHLMNPHGPYNSAPRSPVAEQAGDPLPDVELKPSKSNYGLGPIIPRYQQMRVPPRAKEYRRRYRDEVVYVDTQVERVLAALDARGLRDSTVLVFTADHGEGLGEHDYYFQHGWLANEPSVHVPMIWSQPGRIRSGQRIGATTSLVDVLPTLLAGLDVDPPPLDGRNLGGALVGEVPEDGFGFVLTAYANQLTAVRHGAWKLVHTPPPAEPLPRDHWHAYYPRTESWALYDLARDPGETRDVAAEHPAVLAELRRTLAAWERKNAVPSGTRSVPPKVDEESLERLRALGYAD
jgi:arylsulfatase A-like enzyme